MTTNALRAAAVKIENAGVYKHQFYFANISATKAPIFMKFQCLAHKIAESCQLIFLMSDRVVPDLVV